MIEVCFSEDRARGACNRHLLWFSDENQLALLYEQLALDRFLLTGKTGWTTPELKTLLYFNHARDITPFRIWLEHNNNKRPS